MMPARLAFTVVGLPPKKDGANSMWRKDPEVDRVIALRLAAAEALGDRGALDGDITLTLVVHLDRNDRFAGDLDNFVTGVLDALQHAHPATPWREEPRWLDPRLEHVRPDRWAAITDDAAVVEIVGRKVVQELVADEVWYEVGIQGLAGATTSVDETVAPAHEPQRVRDLQEKLDTVQWVAHVSMLAYAGYSRILGDEQLRGAVFPTTTTANPRIEHRLEPVGVAFTTSFKEISAPQSHDLYTAWQVLAALSAMTAVLDSYLRAYAQEAHQYKIVGLGVLDRIKDVVPLTPFEGWTRLRHFQEVRNISHHNLARINQRFRNKTAEQHHADGPYVFFPSQVNEYRDLILEFVEWCERHAPPPGAVPPH